MKAIKITNPLYLGQLAGRLMAYHRKVKEDGLTYEGLYSFYAQSIQFGGQNSEFWIVQSDGKPVAFAHWSVCPLPYAGKVYFDSVYSWRKESGAVSMLLDKFVEFGKRHRAPVFAFSFVNDKVESILTTQAQKKNLVIKRTGKINYEGRIETE